MTRGAGLTVALFCAVVTHPTARADSGKSCPDECGRPVSKVPLRIGDVACVGGTVTVEVPACKKRDGCETWFIVCWTKRFKIARFELPAEASCAFDSRGRPSDPLRADAGHRFFVAPVQGVLRCGPPTHFDAAAAERIRALAIDNGYECETEVVPTPVLASHRVCLKVLP